jgi:hypothetical protein
MVVVLKQGTIEERGTHQELLRTGGLYSRIFQAQLQLERGVRRRIEMEPDRAVQSLARLHAEWSVPISPSASAAKALESLGKIEVQPVGLHSNPGPEHVFVDNTGRRLSGIIDFGDAYISHSGFDLRRWTEEADRQELLAGYAADEPWRRASTPAGVSSPLPDS